MNKYGVNELRKMFLEFFESKDHLIMESFSLVPHNDKSLLLINSGMAPLKPYFTGQEIPPKKRVVTCQKCIRTGDIENVGKTARHGTFFEMLGNFSFGDYFKKESLEWTWEFLTEVVGLDPDRLYPSVYLEDDEAFEIWNKDIGISKERIFRFGKEDNFWEHGAGPCGPCSEVYYDRGEAYGCGRKDCTVGCDCDRYMEIWNNVFTQFNNDGNNNYTELDQKNIDTGMGLERLACVVQDVESMFDVDTIRCLRETVSELSGREYGKEEKIDTSIRVITDHIRSVTFMISDGIMPSNEGRGYVLRRLLRRASRHGRLLGIEGEFLVGLAREVIDGSKDGYPDLEERKDFILSVIAEEEKKFNKTIDKGIALLADLEAQMEVKGQKVLGGEEAFRLYDTYGFPIDLTLEMLEERGLEVDEEGFKAAMERQKEIARKSWKTTNYMGADATVYLEIDPSISTEFVGYEFTDYDSEIMVLTTESELVKELNEGEQGTIFVQKTPFYATSGGQEADRGIIKTADCEFVVMDVVKLLGGKIGHIGYVEKGTLHVGDMASLEIDKERRALTARNHSCTHLLHKALKITLGNHVEQAGSYVDSERLRFDFTHFAALSKEEIKNIENIVNQAIMSDLKVHVENMTIEEARKTGAAALFGEKYGDIVRVVTMGDFSKELCGGTHVSNTGSIMAFKIVSETSVAAGVRRIEALTSKGLLSYYDHLEEQLLDIASIAKTTLDQLHEKVQTLIKDNKSKTHEIENLKGQLAKDSLGDVEDKVVQIKGLGFLAAKIDNTDMNALRDLGDQLRNKIGEGMVVLASKEGDKVNLIAMATKGSLGLGAHAGNLIKEVAKLVGGGGGGRPDMAQAGGKNPAGIKDALTKAQEVFENQIG